MFFRLKNETIEIVAQEIPKSEIPARLPARQEYIRMQRRCQHLENTIARKNKELHKEIKQLRTENRILKLRIVEQNSIIETLKLQIEELQRMVFGKKKRGKDNQDDNNNIAYQPRQEAKPRDPSSYRRSIPQGNEITETNLYSIQNCGKCNTALQKKKTVIRYEEDMVLPVIESKSPKKIEKQIIETGWCAKCKSQRQAKQIDSQTVTLGQNTKTFIPYAIYILRLSFQQTQDILQDLYRLKISDGEIASILEGNAAKLQPEYESLKSLIRAGPGIHLDETSWKEQGESKYAWVMASTTGEETVFSVGQSRGKGIAENLLGNFNGVRITDCYGAYKNLPGTQQVCWAHLARTAKDIATSDALSPEKQKECQKFYSRLASVYQAVRRVANETFLPQERKRQYAKLNREISTLLVIKKSMPKKLINLKLRLLKYCHALLTCITIPNIPPDNNKAERKLRHLVIKRKTSFGTKTPKGSHVFEINASVLLSQWWSSRTQWFTRTHLKSSF